MTVISGRRNGDRIQSWALWKRRWLLLLSWCLMSSDVIWHIRDKLWPMPKHGSIRKVYACLAVTCHLHFWQNDRDFLRATVVTRGWNGYRNKSQHRKSTLEKKILPPFQRRWTWAPVPNGFYGLCGRHATLNSNWTRQTVGTGHQGVSRQDWCERIVVFLLQCCTGKTWGRWTGYTSAFSESC